MRHLFLIALALISLNCDAILDEEMDGEESTSNSSKKPASTDDEQPAEEEEAPVEDEPTTEEEEPTPQEEPVVDEEEPVEEEEPPASRTVVGMGCETDDDCVRPADDSADDEFICGLTSEEKKAGQGTTCHERCRWPIGTTCTESNFDCWQDKKPVTTGIPSFDRGVCAEGSDPNDAQSILRSLSAPNLRPEAPDQAFGRFLLNGRKAVSFWDAWDNSSPILGLE